MDKELARLFEGLEESSTSITEFYSGLNSCGTNLETIKYVRKHHKWNPAPTLEGYEKDATVSTAYREAGNKAYIKKENAQALIDYNLAIRYAPSNSPELGLGFANRSAVFQAQHKLNEALRDIDSAQNNFYPEDLMHKIEARRDKCLDLLKEECLNENERDGKILAQRRSYSEISLFKLRKPHKRIKYADNVVEIKENDKFGRHVVVTKNVPTGTVLIVETPFAVVQKTDLDDTRSHCSNCLKALHGGGVSCSTCVFAFYCDTKCKAEAESGYHKYECPCLPLIKQYEIPSNAILAFRVLCKIGPDEIYRLFSLPDSKYRESSRGKAHLNQAVMPGFDPDTGTYDPSSYLSVFHLMSDKGGERNELEQVLGSLQSLIMSSVLLKTPSFQNMLKIDDSLEFTDYIASLILRHISTVSLNSMSLHEIPSEVNLAKLGPSQLAGQIRSLEFRQVGTGLYTLTSLLNHSCDPNIARINDTSRGRMAVVALRPLRAGDQLFNCYSTFFGTAPLKERQAYLRSTYNFSCTCSPCQKDWPTLGRLGRAGPPSFTCPACLTFVMTPTEDKRRQRCRKCKQTFPYSSITAPLKSALEKFKTAYDLTMQNKPVEAVGPICESLTTFQTIVSPPFLQTYVAQETLKQALGLIASN